MDHKLPEEVILIDGISVSLALKEMVDESDDLELDDPPIPLSPRALVLEEGVTESELEGQGEIEFNHVENALWEVD